MKRQILTLGTAAILSASSIFTVFADNMVNDTATINGQDSINAEQAKQIAIEYWNFKEGIDSDSGNQTSMVADGITEYQGKYYYAYRLRWLVDNQHWSTIDWLYISMDSGKTYSDLKEISKEENKTTESNSENQNPSEEIKETQLSWIVSPQFDYQNIIAVADMMPLDMREEIKEAVGNYEERAFYYIDGQAGMIDYKGNVIIDSSKALFTDKDYGIVSKDWESYDINGNKTHMRGGGGIYSFYWNELTQKIIYSEIELTEQDNWSHKYMVSMESVNIDSKFLDTINIDENAVQKNGTYRLIGKNGQLVSQEQFEDIKTDKKYYYQNIIGDYAVVKKNGLWGYIREDGTWISECIYEDAYPFHNGIAAVKKDGKAGFIREDGTEISEFLFEETRSVYNGMAWVKLNDKWGVLDIEKLSEITMPDNDTTESKENITKQEDTTKQENITKQEAVTINTEKTSTAVNDNGLKESPKTEDSSLFEIFIMCSIISVGGFVILTVKKEKI